MQNNNVVQPYLFFNGACDEALEFYRKAVGAQVEVRVQYNETPEPLPPGSVPSGFENKVMHASFRVGQTVLMASDACETGPTNFEGFSLSLTLSDESETDRVFGALSEGGKVIMPLTKTFWSPRFGMLKDRFGLSWMISMPPGNAK